MVASSAEVNLAVDRQALLEQLLGQLDTLPPALRADVAEALAEEGKLLHQPASFHDGRWALLPLCLARELQSGAEPLFACSASLAMECVICATDLFDDVMDEDVTPLIERLGMARVLNVALALISLAQGMLLAPTNAAASLSSPLCLLHAIQQALLLATAGQQQDLLAERQRACELQREDCIEMAAAKAGALLSLACRLGAICAGVQEGQIEQCAEMGRLLGIAAQLDNDAHDLSCLLQPVSGSLKSDLKRGKKTLPVVLAAHSLRESQGMDAREIDRALQDVASLQGEEQAIYCGALREGMLATWGLSLLYRERARDYFPVIPGGRRASAALYQLLGFDELLREA